MSSTYKKKRSTTNFGIRYHYRKRVFFGGGKNLELSCLPEWSSIVFRFSLQMELVSSDSQSSQSFEMSSSSFADSTCSMESSSNNVVGVNNAGAKKISLAKTSTNSRSSVSSMASTSSICSNSLHNYGGSSSNSANLNHALALVTNKLEREQRKNDEEATRKLTLLRQRKISAVLKVNKNICLDLQRYAFSIWNFKPEMAF